ncbi:MAG: hypothetical protein ABSE92_01265 [Terriglobales bacterium]|jgi:hypothetical protein
MSRTKVLSVITLVAALTLMAGVAMAASAPPADTLKVDYFANAGGSADATVRIVNPGTTYANLCADIFVFDSQEELVECGSCPVSPDDLRTLSVNGDLLSNPLNGKAPTTGDIKIVSAATTGGACPLPTGKTRGGTIIDPVPAVRVWTTHIQNNGTLTEGSSQDATFSASEYTALQQQCYAIQLVGSGTGLLTCGTGE